MATQPDNNQNRQQGGGLFGSLFGGGNGGGFFQSFIQLFTGMFAGGGNAGGGGLFQSILNAFGLGSQAPTQQEQEDLTRQRVINEQQADLAAQGLYPSTGQFAQDGTAGPLMQHAYRLQNDPAYAKDYMRTAMRDPDLDAMDVMKIQASLNKLGYDVGDINGRMNNETRADLDKFLQDNPDIKRTMPAATVEATERKGFFGRIADSVVETVKHTRDHITAPSSTPGSVKGLLGIIGEHESGHNYNAAYGHSEGIRGKDFTNMTVNQVIAWQRQYVNDGSPSSAVGKYQIIRKTLVGLKDDMDLTGNEKFTPELQDRMAVRLLEQRGLNDFKTGRISAEKFMNNVSKEWASMPKDLSGRGYYDGDGLNKSLTGAQPVLAAIHDIKRAAPEVVREVAAAAPAPARRAAANDDIDFGRSVASVAKGGMDSVRGLAQSAFSTASSVVDKVDNVLDNASEAVFGKGGLTAAAQRWNPFG